MQHLYTYICYRDYLRDFYLDTKAGDPGYSFRKMARSMGFTSPNFLKLVIDGKRNIGTSALPKIIRGLGLGKRETEYFSCLVRFAQAKTSAQRDMFFQRIRAIRSHTTAAIIEPEKLEYYSHWYNPVIRELITGRNAADVDFEELGREVFPPISEANARDSVELLLKLGFIIIGPNGAYTQLSPAIATPAEISSFFVRKFTGTMIDRAKSALESVDPSQREISSLTLKISRRGYSEIKTRIRQFKEELMQIALGDSEVDRVYQVNFQLFPVSRQRRGGNGRATDGGQLP